MVNSFACECGRVGEAGPSTSLRYGRDDSDEVWTAGMALWWLGAWRSAKIVLMGQATQYTSEAARALLEEWTKGESLRKHALAVAACAEAYGRIEGLRMGLSGEELDGFADRYCCAGLLHDMDYERHPSTEEHPFVGVKRLRELGWPEEILHAILAHADYSGVTPESHMDRALFACDELAGFLTACALVKPTRCIADVEVAGVKKKMKDKAFARAVKREDMTAGAELLGLPIEEHVGNCLRAMQARAGELGL